MVELAWHGGMGCNTGGIAKCLLYTYCMNKADGPLSRESLPWSFRLIFVKSKLALMEQVIHRKEVQ